MLKVKYETIKLLENNMGENLGDQGLGSVSSDITPKTQPMKEKY